jgi:hypothetical protein
LIRCGITRGKWEMKRDKPAQVPKTENRWIAAGFDAMVPTP